MSILILGGTGFIGKALVNKLINSSFDKNIFILSRGIIYTQEIDSRIIHLKGDIQNYTNWNEILNKVSTVYYMTSGSNPSECSINPALAISESINGCLNFLEYYKNFPHIKMIFCSSGGAVYGQVNEESIPIKENNSTNPISTYGIIKLMIEKYILSYTQNYNLNSLILRISNPYGIGQKTKTSFGIIPNLIEKIILNINFPLYGNSIRDYLYIDDLINALYLLKDYTGSEQILNIGSGQGNSIISIIDIVEKILKKSALINYLPIRNFDVPVNILNINKIQKEINWSPQINLEEGIQKTISWLKPLILKKAILPQNYSALSSKLISMSNTIK